jgi:hypothetical protein
MRDHKDMPNLFLVPVLTRRRIWAALLVAMTTDGLQLLAGPLGWLFLDQALDLVTMVLTTALIGFHPLLLPTFILEFMPVADLLPSWTASVALVVAMRRKATVNSAPPALLVPPRMIEAHSHPDAPPRVIDV